MKTWNNRLFPWGRKKTVKTWGRLCNILEELLREIVSMIGHRQSAKVRGTYWLVIQFVHTSHFNLNEESSIVELKPLNKTLKFYQTLEPVLWMTHLSYGLVRSKREYYHNCSLVVFLCSFLLLHTHLSSLQVLSTRFGFFSLGSLTVLRLLCVC